YFKDVYGVTEETIGYFFTIFGVVGVLMRFGLVGWFNQRFGEIRTMQMGTISLFLGLALMRLPAAVLPPGAGIVVFVLLLTPWRAAWHSVSAPMSRWRQRPDDR